MQSGREMSAEPLDGAAASLSKRGTTAVSRAAAADDGASRQARLIDIVEDDDTLASTFQQVLEEERGWSTMVVGDGEEALRILPAARPDMILLDVTLPGLDGVSLYRMLRGRRETAATPILIVTASHEWELQRLGL